MAHEAPEVNISNTNARLVLDALGEDIEDLCGSETGESFLGRVLTALAIAPVDEGVPVHTPDGASGRFVECGRRPGYLHDILEQLHEVADWARTHDRKVHWA